MPSQSAAQTLLLMPDPRQTPLGERSASGLQRMAYTPYGERSASAGPGSRTGFNGQLREPQGWYHLGNGHRVYNPVLMRFHSPDLLSPFGAGGINCYAYCKGDPVNFTDPTGKFGEFFKELFWDRPLGNLILSSSLLVVNFLGAIITPPLGMALYASRLVVGGAAAGITGSLLHILGLPEVGRPIALAGTLASAAGAVTRAGLAIQRLWRERAVIFADMPKRVRHFFVGGYSKPPSPDMAMSSVAPAPAPAVAVPASPVAVPAASAPPVSAVPAKVASDMRGSLSSVESLTQTSKKIRKQLVSSVRRESEGMRDLGIPS